MIRVRFKDVSAWNKFIDYYFGPEQFLYFRQKIKPVPFFIYEVDIVPGLWREIFKQ